jgi:hypothetical protein
MLNTFTLRTCNQTLRTLSKPAFSQVSRVTADLNIETKNVQTAPGVSLSSHQQTLIGSVLDLFAGRPSLPKLALWADNATFTDPITIAEGREKYSAQWYGLQSAFSEIERLHHEVKDAGNPILMDLKTRYVIKGIGKEQTIQSVVAIHTDGEGKITKVEDKWDGKLPDSSIANAFRHLNAVTVPKFVGVPKNDAEDEKKGNQ